jgi:hypothetical protein
LQKTIAEANGLSFSCAKTQSAMEYLMTYGWAILVIAVVLAALFSLGVFNSANFAPKAKAGSCRVFRSVAQTTLVGQCTGLLPQFVAQFNGVSSYVYDNNPSNLPTGIVVTITAWVNPSQNQPSGCGAFCGVVSFGFGITPGAGRLLSLNDVGGGIMYTSMVTYDDNNYVPYSGPIVKDGQWNFIAMVMNGKSITLYTNQQNVTVTFGSLPISTASTDLAIGSVDYFGSELNGSIANVQIYNTTLSANEIQALYQEGIGGAPINPQYLVGWWPLNGDTNDYSGNNNNGVPTNIQYNGTWTNRYTTP